MAFLHHRYAILALLLVPASLSFAATPPVDNLNPTGSGCVDPKGFVDCYAAQLAQLSSCGQIANSTCSDTNTHLQTCLAGCDGAHLASKIGCWLQSCWNQVYSCEYQATAAQYVSGMAIQQFSVSIPFYPAPPGDLPGGCSCNVGYVYGNFSTISAEHCLPVAENGSREQFEECTCCQASYTISNVLNTCPKSDLSIFGFAENLAKSQNTISRSPDSCAVLDHGLDSATYCATTYGVEDYEGKLVYNPLKLPADKPGTEPLSNSAGTPFTTFVDVTTLALPPGFSTTITPVKFNSQNAEGSLSGLVGATISAATGTGTVGGAVSGSGSVTGSGKSTTGSSTGTAASSTPTKSSAQVTINLQMSFVASGLVAGLFYFL